MNTDDCLWMMKGIIGLMSVLFGTVWTWDEDYELVELTERKEQ